jgi:hypothetical protein
MWLNVVGILNALFSRHHVHRGSRGKAARARITGLEKNRMQAWGQVMQRRGGMVTWVDKLVSHVSCINDECCELLHWSHRQEDTLSYRFVPYYHHLKSYCLDDNDEEEVEMRMWIAVMMAEATSPLVLTLCETGRYVYKIVYRS